MNILKYIVLIPYAFLSILEGSRRNRKLLNAVADEFPELRDAAICGVSAYPQV